MRHLLRMGLLSVGVLAALPEAALAQADFYKGKTIQVVIGARLSGSLSIAAQLVTRHLGKYVPGNPTVILRQMPGGAHLVASGYVYNVAEPDGLTILAANPNIAMAQLAKMSAVRFEVNQFQWIGSSGVDGSLFSIRSDMPYKTYQEFRDSGKEWVAGTTGPGSNAHDMPLLLKEFAGAPLKLVAGYAANGDILLAVERNEADSWSALATTIKLGVDRGAVRALVRSRTPVPGFNHLPVDEELATDPIGKALMGIRGIPASIGRPFALRPEVPADRVAMLRAAFDKTIQDPTFLAEAKTAKIDMGLIPAEQVIALFKEMMSQSPQVLEAMNKYLKVGE